MRARTRLRASPGDWLCPDNSGTRRWSAGGLGRAAGDRRPLHARRHGSDAGRRRVAHTGGRARRLHDQGARVYPDHAPVGRQAEWASRATGPRIASTLVPVTQGRDWRVYDWPARHAAAAALMKARQPEIVMLGDSIMHFWGGDPSGEHVGGRRTAPDVWDRFFSGETS